MSILLNTILATAGLLLSLPSLCFSFYWQGWRKGRRDAIDEVRRMLDIDADDAFKDAESEFLEQNN